MSYVVDGGWLPHCLSGPVGDGRQQAVVEHQLRVAVETANLSIEAQPIFDLRSGRVAMVELMAMLVLDGETSGNPHDYLPLLDEFGLLGDVNHLLLSHVGDARLLWRESPDLRDVAAMLRLPVTLLTADGFRQELIDQIDRFGLVPGELAFSVRDPIGVGELPSASEALQGIRQLGMSVAIDEGRTEPVPSLCPNGLPAGIVRLAQKPTASGRTPGEEVRRLGPMVDLAHEVGQVVVIDGIDTEAQLEQAVGTGAGLGQGFWLGRPCPLDELMAIAAWARWGSTT